MAVVARLIYRELSNLSDEFYKDPRVRNLPLVGSPVPVITIITVYVLFVKKWGPQWMIDRKPLNVKFLIQSHNVLQIITNAFVFTLGTWNSYLQKGFSLTCQPVEFHNTSPAQMRLMLASYIYYLTKYVDLFDTVFFVLRKKNSHVTFLHVYHHCVMVMAVWIYMTFLYGGHATMLGIINSFVHMVMYSYYLASSMNLKIDLIPWKKRITQLQILQFCYLVFHFLMPVLNNYCHLPFNTINMVAVLQNVFMTAMFSDFYLKAYVKRESEKQICK